MRKTYLDSKSVFEFDKARIRAFFDNVQALLTKRSNSVVPFEEIRTRLGMPTESYKGIMTVPVKAIVGSENRPKDFSLSFNPKKKNSSSRWSRIYHAHKKMDNLPPVVLYEAGNIYFIRDGNHRVSVAKKLNIAFIDAEVYSLNTHISFTPSMNTNKILKTISVYEKKHFIKETNFSEDIIKNYLYFGREERYDMLTRDIERHRRFLQAEQDSENKHILDFNEAANSWLQSLFLPFCNLAEKHGMVSPKKKILSPDLYSWWLEYEEEIEEIYSACALPDDFFAEYYDSPT